MKLPKFQMFLCDKYDISYESECTYEEYKKIFGNDNNESEN